MTRWAQPFVRVLRTLVWMLAVLAIPIFAVQKGTQWIQRAAGVPTGSEKLRMAATDGNLVGIRDALEEGVSINDTDEEGYTALHCATMSGNPQAVRALINAGANLRAESVRHVTPFGLAIALQEPEIIRIYLDAGIDPNERLNYEATALYMACVNGDEQTARMLLNAGAKVNLATESGGTPLIACVCATDTRPSALMQLLRAGADVNAADENGFTALMNAAVRDRTDFVQMLLDHGADPMRLNRDGCTARDLAEQDQCFESAKILAKAKWEIKAI